MKINMRYFLIILWLFVATSIDAEEICVTDRASIIERVVNRSYPSVIGEWDHVYLNYMPPGNEWEWSYLKEMLARHDLFVQGGFRSIRWRYPERNQLVSGDVEHVQYERNQINALIYLASMYYYGATPEGYREDWPYWLRDESGNRIQDEGWREFFIDFTLPGAQDHFVDRAVAIAQCGVFDGIFFDVWGEDEEDIPGPDGTAHLYHCNRADALVSLVKRIREAVGDDLLIIVNPNDRKVPRSAPYLNGSSMELVTDTSYSRERLIEIENTLSWYEENCRYPQVNCLNASGDPSEPLDSPRNQQQARVFTTLSLTHSNGYVTFGHLSLKSGAHQHGYEVQQGHSEEHARAEPHEHVYRYWYSFWDADLGRPVGEKAQSYEDTEGLFIRKFTNGWAVYNRSGKEQQIEFSEAVSGVASGVEGEHSHTLPDLDGEIYLKSELELETPPTVDVNGDGVVNIQDLVIVANALGEAEPDLNGDGMVNIQDLVIVANAF